MQRADSLEKTLMVERLKAKEKMLAEDTMDTLCEELTHWKRHWCWERLKAGGEWNNRGWDSWIASQTQWTWAWGNSRRLWRTGKHGMLQSMGCEESDTTEQLNKMTTNRHMSCVCLRHIQGVDRHIYTLQNCSVQFSHSVVSNSLWLHGLQHTRLPCPSPSPGLCSNSCPSSWWCHPTISSSVAPFSLCPQCFPASGSFSVGLLFTSGGQSTGASASASVLPTNIQGWFPLGLTGLISLQSKELLRVFSSTMLKATILRCSAFFMVQFSHLWFWMWYWFSCDTQYHRTSTIWTFVPRKSPRDPCTPGTWDMRQWQGTDHQARRSVQVLPFRSLARDLREVACLWTVTLTCRSMALAGLLLKVARRWVQKDLGNQCAGRPEPPGDHRMTIISVIITELLQADQWAWLTWAGWRRKAPCRPPQQTCTGNTPNCFLLMQSAL